MRWWRVFAAGLLSSGCNGSAPVAPADASSDSATAGEPVPDAGTPVGDATTTDVPVHDGTADDVTSTTGGDAVADDARTTDALTGDGEAGGATTADAGDAGYAGDGGYLPPSALCTASCPAGETSCLNGCGPIDWRLGCSSACHPDSETSMGVAGCKTANAMPACGGPAECTVSECAPGFADCDKNPSNGCEADLESPSTCGSCSVACAPGQLCSPSGCVSSCTPPLTLCTDRCVNVAQDPDHCGGCSTTCPAKAGGFPTCAAAACGVACWPGFTACPSGGCSDLQNDPLACGGCASPCPVPTAGRAVCVAGQCQATCQPGWTLVGTTCRPPATAPSMLVTGLSAPEDIAVDATRVYWTDTTAGTVSSAPLAGGSVTVLATGQAKPLRLAVDDTQVYWSNNLGGAIMHAPKDGSGGAAVLASATQPAGVAVLDGYVYWANDGADANGQASVQRVSVNGGTPSTVLTNHVTDELQGDGVRVIATSNDSNAIAGYYLLEATGVHLLWSGADPTEVWFGQDGSSYYVMSGTNITGLDVFSKATLTGTGGIPLYGLAADTNSVPRPNLSSPGVGDGCALYYVDTTGIEMLVHGESWPALVVSSSTVHRIVTSAGVVYWTDTTGAIGQVAVP